MASRQKKPAEGETSVEELGKLYRDKRRLFELFSQQVANDFLTQPSLNTGVPTIIHSVRHRLKGDDNFAEKIRRKRAEGRTITKQNLFSEITDCAGLRILHLHQSQFSAIHEFIKSRLKSKSWKLLEKPIAYTWDPESVDYFKKYSLQTKLKPSHYTSVHYLIAPANDQHGICCEVQVRTLFEEIWGEVDHSVNYPHKSEKMATVEQLRVLSKLVSTGSRLADAIFKVHADA
jgi:ppGpp synthetase/RelA/SpoT-type nucleotidyltranferase